MKLRKMCKGRKIELIIQIIKIILMIIGLILFVYYVRRIPKI